MKTRSMDSPGWSSKISWMRHLGAMQAWLDLCGCTGMAWDVTGIGARAFF